MRKAVLILAALAASVLALHAQGLPQHEFQIEGFGGVSTLQYSIRGASTEPGFGGGGGFLYTWHFHPRWGLITGVEASFHQASLKYSNDYGALSGKWSASGNLFVSYLVGMREKQKYTQLRIPVMIQYMAPIGAKGHYFCLAAGGKFGFRLAGTYSQSAQDYHYSHNSIVHDYDFTMSSPDDADELNDPLVFYQRVGALGPSGETAPYASSGQIGKVFDFLASIDLGFRWRLNSSMALYTGLFIDAGMVSQEDGGTPIVSADGSGASAISACAVPTPSLKISDVVGGKRVQANIPSYSENLTSRPKTIGFGLKVCFAFGKVSASDAQPQTEE